MKSNPFASNRRLVWSIWLQWKVFQERPSKTYNIKNQLAAFYFDRGTYLWGNLVERSMDEAEQRTRQSMRNRAGTDTFVASARQAIFNKLMGITETKNVYRQPQVTKKIEEKKIDAEGEIDLKAFN
jgi:hypothetical protein